jgi:hypothetical protein
MRLARACCSTPDFQYGPDNWASDNRFLNQFGIGVFPDNFQPATQITDLAADRPTMQSVHTFAMEGGSQFLIVTASLDQTLVRAKCSLLERRGCAVGPAEQAKIKPSDMVAAPRLARTRIGASWPAPATATPFTAAQARMLTSSTATPRPQHLVMAGPSFGLGKQRRGGAVAVSQEPLLLADRMSAPAPCVRNRGLLFILAAFLALALVYTLRADL